MTSSCGVADLVEQACTTSCSVLPVNLQELSGFLVHDKGIEVLFYNPPVQCIVPLRPSSPPWPPDNGLRRTPAQLNPSHPSSTVEIQPVCFPGGSSSNDCQPGQSSSTPYSGFKATPSTGRASRKDRGKGRRKASSGNGQGDVDMNQASKGEEEDDTDDAEPWMWVCPFFRVDPFRHHACLWERTKRNISYLKQHVMQEHKASARPRCPRCYKEFSTQLATEDHVREQACALVPERPPDGLTDAQISRLKKGLRLANNPESYRILFDIVAEGRNPAPFWSDRPALIADEDRSKESLDTHLEVFRHRRAATLAAVLHQQSIQDPQISMNQVVNAVIQDFMDFYHGLPVALNFGLAPRWPVTPLAHQSIPQAGLSQEVIWPLERQYATIPQDPSGPASQRHHDLTLGQLGPTPGSSLPPESAASGTELFAGRVSGSESGVPPNGGSSNAQFYRFQNPVLTTPIRSPVQIGRSPFTPPPRPPVIGSNMPPTAFGTSNMLQQPHAGVFRDMSVAGAAAIRGTIQGLSSQQVMPHHPVQGTNANQRVFTEALAVSPFHEPLLNQAWWSGNSAASYQYPLSPASMHPYQVDPTSASNEPTGWSDTSSTARFASSHLNQ